MFLFNVFFNLLIFFLFKNIKHKLMDKLLTRADKTLLRIENVNNYNGGGGEFQYPDPNKTIKDS